MLALVTKLIESLRAILEISHQLEESLGLEPRADSGLKEIQQLAQLAIRIAKAPRMDRGQIDHPVWETRQIEIAELVEQGKALRANRMELEGKVSDVAWGVDLAVTRRQLAAHGGSPFRWFNRGYREAVSTLKGIIKWELPRQLSERLKIVDAVVSVQLTTRSLVDDASRHQLGRDAFGTEWRGIGSDWDVLGEIVAWDKGSREAWLAHGHRLVLAKLDRPELCQSPLNALSARLRPSFDRLKTLFDRLDFDCNQAFGIEPIISVPIRDLIARLGEWRGRPEIMADWIGYQACRRLLGRLDLTVIVSAIDQGRLTLGTALSELENSFNRALACDLAGLRERGHQKVDAAPEASAIEQAELQTLGADAFGRQWKGILSDWAALEASGTWDRECREANLPWNHRGHLAHLASNDLLIPPLRILSVHLKSVPGRLQALFKSLALDVAEIFHQESSLRIPIRDLLGHLRGWQADPEGLSKWIAYQLRRSRLNASGLEPLVTALHEGRIRADAAVDQLSVASPV